MECNQYKTCCRQQAVRLMQSVCVMARTGLSWSRAAKSGAMAREWKEHKRARDATRRARPLSWAQRRTRGTACPSWAPRSSRGGGRYPSGSSATQINTVLQYIPTLKYWRILFHWKKNIEREKLILFPNNKHITSTSTSTSGARARTGWRSSSRRRTRARRCIRSMSRPYPPRTRPEQRICAITDTHSHNRAT